MAGPPQQANVNDNKKNCANDNNDNNNNSTITIIKQLIYYNEVNK